MGNQLSDSQFHYIAGDNRNPSKEALFDVVFIHGLNGDCHDTWTHENGEFWLEWLAKDYPSVNVYSVGYDSHYLASLSKGSGGGLIDIATMLLERVISRPTRTKPVLFIAHSLGGLVAKQMLRKSCEASSSRRKKLCSETLGVVFVGTPHQGAQLASSIQSVLSIGASQQVKAIGYAEPALLDLNDWFRNWTPNTKLQVSSFYELEKYNGLLLVDQVTANPNVLGCDPVALQGNHVKIVKLPDRSAQLYQSVASMIDDFKAEISAEIAVIGDQSAEALLKNELDTYTTHAPDDRRNLSEKLHAAGRSDEIRRAERQKERFSMTLQRSIAQPAAVRRYTRLLSSIETRFQRHVAAAIANGQSRSTVDSLIQENVLDPTLLAYDADGGEGTSSFVDSAYYYLAGNCHIGWDNE